MGELFRKLKRSIKPGEHRDRPTACNETVVKHYARRCANCRPSVSKRIRQPIR
jgi:hypothetical protein